MVILTPRRRRSSRPGARHAYMECVNGRRKTTDCNSRRRRLRREEEEVHRLLLRLLAEGRAGLGLLQVRRQVQRRLPAELDYYAFQRAILLLGMDEFEHIFGGERLSHGLAGDACTEAGIRSFR